MTLPDERTRAIQYARQFLTDLVHPHKTKKIPLEIRKRARSVLKHFPGELDMEAVARIVPGVFGLPDKKEDA